MSLFLHTRQFLTNVTQSLPVPYKVHSLRTHQKMELQNRRISTITHCTCHIQEIQQHGGILCRLAPLTFKKLILKKLLFIKKD